MPIYAYKCESCGHAKDVLQKMSDSPLTQCPQCGADAFKKQLTAAGFQLKGSGWYVTDFRGGSTGAPAAPGGESAGGGGEPGKSTDPVPASAPAAAPPGAATSTAATPAPLASPAPTPSVKKDSA